MLYDWFKNIVFAYPQMLILFALLLIMIGWYVKKNNDRQATMKVSTANSFTVSSAKIYFRHLPFVLRLLALCCIILALARPQRHNDEQLKKGQGIDIVLDRKSTRLNSSHVTTSRMPSSA